MPRRKKLPEGEVPDPTYGIWMTSKYEDGKWFVDNNGNIVSSDFLGIIKAQANRLNKDGGSCSIKIIGNDGEPEELE